MLQKMSLLLTKRPYKLDRLFMAINSNINSNKAYSNGAPLLGTVL